MSKSESKEGKIELTTMPEQIATISSPSSTGTLSLEILEKAAMKKLIGELIWFLFNQEGTYHYALGQITEIELQNYMLEFSEMRSLARQRGSVNPISGLQDTHKGIMTTGAVFRYNGSNYDPAILGTVPPTGTAIFKANDEMIGKLLEQHSERLFYPGHFYESNTKLPLWFLHFGQPEDGGAGEAYHIGIYGKTGSGKSTLAKMIMLAYAKHPQMAIFVFDPAGEFTKAAKGEKGSELFFLDLKSILKGLGKKVVLKSVRDLVFDRWEVFEEILYESDFLQTLTIPKGDNRETACRLLRENLQRNGITLENLSQRGSFDQAIAILGDPNIQTQIYPSRDPRNRLAAAVATLPRDLFQTRWEPVMRLFNTAGKVKVDSLVAETFNLENRTDRPVVIINLAKEEVPEGLFWNDSIKAMIINRIVRELTDRGEKLFLKGEFLNTLVILDEAQRLVPREHFDNEKQERLRNHLIDAAQTTRKYGLGWMYLSLSLSTLHRDIYHENRISFYGFGLSSGSELSTLRDLISDPHSIKLYQSFRDPHTIIEQRLRTYSFMTKGPCSPLSFSGSPMFLTMFNDPAVFLMENNLGKKGKDPKKENPKPTIIPT